jgi:predicted RecA/RadA family phage recombinase
MALAIFAHDGDSIDYTPTSDVAAGDVVVQGDMVGVARTPIVANAPGSLAVAGVFDFPKATTTGSAIAAGTKAYWDAAASVATATAGSNKLLGKTVKAAADADTTVRVRLSQ